MKNSLAIARFLENHTAVERVLHPWLESHPQNELAKRQSSGHSGMVTFYIRGAAKECQIFFDKLNVFKPGSLGACESLVSLP